MSDCEQDSEIKIKDLNENNKQIQTTLGDEESYKNVLNTRFQSPLISPAKILDRHSPLQI